MEGIEILELYFRAKVLIDVVEKNGYVSESEIKAILGITNDKEKGHDK